MKPTAKRIVIAHNLPTYRQGLKSALETLDDWQIACVTGNWQEALVHTTGKHTELLMVGSALRGGSTLELVSEVCKVRPQTRALLLAAPEHHRLAVRATRRRRCSVISWQAEVKKIVEAARCVMAGQRYIGMEFLEDAMQLDATNGDAVTCLADRELETFIQFGQGLSTTQIAETMGISTKTVYSTANRITAKLELPNLRELRRFSIEWTVARTPGPTLPGGPLSVAGGGGA